MKMTSLAILSIIAIITLTTISNLSVSESSSLVFYDDFEDNDISDWTAGGYSGKNWTTKPVVSEGRILDAISGHHGGGPYGEMTPSANGSAMHKSLSLSSMQIRVNMSGLAALHGIGPWGYGGSAIGVTLYSDYTEGSEDGYMFWLTSWNARHSIVKITNSVVNRTILSGYFGDQANDAGPWRFERDAGGNWVIYSNRIRTSGGADAEYTSFVAIDVFIWDESGHPAYIHGVYVYDLTPQPPVAVISAPTSAFVNELVTFDGSGSYDPDGTVVSYFWDFGDGTTANTTEPIIEHTYNQTDTYNVTLTVTDNDGLTNTATANITVTHLMLSVKLSGEFDYVSMENVKIMVATLVTNAETIEPISNADVTMEIYDPDGELWVSANMVERLPARGIYEWKSAETIRQIQLEEGVYLVYVTASVHNCSVASDILLFHIDPPLESSISSLTPLLYYAIAIIVLIAGTIVGVALFKRHKGLQVASY